MEIINTPPNANTTKLIKAQIALQTGLERIDAIKLSLNDLNKLVLKKQQFVTFDCHCIVLLALPLKVPINSFIIFHFKILSFHFHFYLLFP